MSTNGTLRIALGADHGGYQLKEDLEAYLRQLGHEVDDRGTGGAESVDYPDFADPVCRRGHRSAHRIR